MTEHHHRVGGIDSHKDSIHAAIIDEGCVPWIGDPDKGWRLRSLLAFAERYHPRALVWADDQAPRKAGQRIDERLGIPRLVIRPHRNVGLTVDDVHRVRSFIDDPARQQS